MAKPISPKDVQSVKDSILPDVVFEVFNALIVENWNGTCASVKQDEAVERIAKALDISRDAAFKHGYLDVESVYSKAGWKVKYDKPAYNESYDAYFVFSKK